MTNPDLLLGEFSVVLVKFSVLLFELSFKRKNVINPPKINEPRPMRKLFIYCPSHALDVKAEVAAAPPVIAAVDIPNAPNILS